MGSAIGSMLSDSVSWAIGVFTSITSATGTLPIIAVGIITVSVVRLFIMPLVGSAGSSDSVKPKKGDIDG